MPQLRTDGAFGPKTKEWVIKFQRLNPPLKPDGIVGHRQIEFAIPIEIAQTNIAGNSPRRNRDSRLERPVAIAQQQRDVTTRVVEAG